jgi:4-amino-4-deoxy-L-arabinose transferase-like glycosyltransferase
METLFLIAIVARLALLGFPTLVDPSEARFANAALRMVDSGNWVVPQIYTDANRWEPYVAKPPLHMWLGAATFSIFGAGSWSARLPSFIDTILTLLLLVLFVRRLIPGTLTEDVPRVFLSSIGVFLVGVAATTDPTLMLCITGALVSIPLCFESEGRISKGWGLLASLFLALGFLTKGPVAVVLPGMTVFLWVWFYRQWFLLRKLPWISGSLLFFAITLPWYLVAERESPGFLNYYFVVENFKRYFYSRLPLRYGSAHRYPFGVIWLFLFVAMIPWSFALVSLRRREFRARVTRACRENRWLGYAVLWALTPAIFFSFARQILPTYALPATPASAIVLAWLWREEKIPRCVNRVWLFSISFYLAAIILGAPTIASRFSTEAILDEVMKGREIGEVKVAFLRKRPQSALFLMKTKYRGRLTLRVIEELGEIRAGAFDVILISSRDLKRLKEVERRSLVPVRQVGGWLEVRMSLPKKLDIYPDVDSPA